MHLFDPARPQLPTGPALLCPQLCVVPAITVHFLPSGAFELAVFLPSGRGWSRHTHNCSTLFRVERILLSWPDNPEGVAKEFFSWDPSNVTPSPVKPALSGTAASLEDLGL